MWISQEHIDKIEKDYQALSEIIQAKGDPLLIDFQGLTVEETICLKHLYAYMPLSDIANYDSDLFLQFVRHSLMLRETYDWCKDLSDVDFLNYVLQYRINNENLVFYSQTFFDTLNPRIQGKTMEEAVIEVNYWCYEVATYQSTDIRTMSPFATIQNAYGRCGEESVLTVTALRSVGIPARQCYTPRWAHCDDNHAWVEVLTQGQWHYLGACEPEIKLDRGWFREPASKGMLIHARLFSSMVGQEKITRPASRFIEVNATSHYGETAIAQVYVRDAEGQVLVNQEVSFMLVNFAQLYPLVTIPTDEAGCARFETGLGHLMVHVAYDGQSYYKQMDLRDHKPMTFVLDEAHLADRLDTFIMVPPSGGVLEQTLTDAETKAQTQWNQSCEAIRKDFMAGFYDEASAKEKAQAIIGNRAFQEGKGKKALETIGDALVKSRGNYPVFEAYFSDSLAGSIEDKLDIIANLSKKDYSDCSLDVLEEHLNEMRQVKDQEADTLSQYTQAMAVSYIFAPRFGYEMMVPYRRGLRAALGSQQLRAFHKNPSDIKLYVLERVALKEDLEYASLKSNPVATLTLGYGNQGSIDLLMMAIGRTALLPCRYNPITNEAEYYSDDAWKSFHQVTCDTLSKTLVISCADGLKPVYEKDFTISRFTGEAYELMDCMDISWQGDLFKIDLPVGSYELLLVKRLMDGTVLAKKYAICMDATQANHVLISKKDLEALEQSYEALEASRELILHDYALECVYGGQIGQVTSLNQVIEEVQYVSFMALGEEPTEHLLNEMLEDIDRINDLAMPLIFVVSSEEELEQKTFSSLLAVLNKAKVFVNKSKELLTEVAYEHRGSLSQLLPISGLVDENLSVLLSTEGYRVGSVKMLLDYCGEHLMKNDNI